MGKWGGHHQIATDPGLVVVTGTKPAIHRYTQHLEDDLQASVSVGNADATIYICKMYGILRRSPYKIHVNCWSRAGSTVSMLGGVPILTE